MTLTDIQQSFYSRSFDISSISTWLMGLLVVVVLLSLYLGIRYIRARRVRYYPHGSIVDPMMIRNVMRAAFDQRRPFEVQVAADAAKRRPTLRCSPEDLTKDALLLEINGLKSLSDRWLGRPVHVFFRILLNKDFTYYTFASRIDSIRTPRQGVCQIALSMPESLENRQKRSFLRITPPKEFFMGAAAWYSDTLPPPEKYNDIAIWPRPKLFSIPDKANHFKIVDLSAGGVRMAVPSSVLSNQRISFRVTEQLMLMLDLFDPEQNRRLRFWLLCRIQNVWVEHPSGDAQVGMQVLSWARPRENQDSISETSAQGIEWLRLSPSNEVEPLGNWIMRRHLELFRDNPADSF